MTGNSHTTQPDVAALQLRFFFDGNATHDSIAQPANVGESAGAILADVRRPEVAGRFKQNKKKKIESKLDVHARLYK